MIFCAQVLRRMNRRTTTSNLFSLIQLWIYLGCFSSSLAQLTQDQLRNMCDSITTLGKYIVWYYLWALKLPDFDQVHVSLHVGVKFVRHVGVPEVAVSRWPTVSKMASVCTIALYLCQEAVDCCKSWYSPGSKAKVCKTSLVECRSAG